MMGSVPKNGSPLPALMPQMRLQGAWPSFFEEICIKAIYLVALIALYFALAKTYTEFLQPLYSYEHFKQNFVPTREVESLIALGIAAAVMPTDFRRPSDLFMSLAIVITLVPTAMMYAYADISWETAVMTCAGLAVIFLAREIPIGVPVWPLVGVSTIYFFTGLSLLGVATAAYQMGFDSFSLDLLDVYGRRAIANSEVTGISAYIVDLALHSNLIATIVSFISRNWVALVVNVAASFLFFGLSGNKGTFYGTFVFIILSVIMRSRFCIVIIVSLFSAIFVCYYLFFMSIENLTFASLFEQRSLIVPVYLNDLYLNIFKDTKLYFSYSKISLGLIDNPLQLDVANMVGYYWEGRATMHANTGFVGSGYMNAGLIGILIYAVVIGLCCRVIDQCAQRRSSRNAAAIICLPGFLNAVTSTDLPTLLFSGGWTLAILLVAVADLSDDRCKASNVSSMSRMIRFRI
ncbi:MAG: hypothetical protein ACREDM_02670 [Methylocella sp.]